MLPAGHLLLRHCFLGQTTKGAAIQLLPQLQRCLCVGAIAAHDPAGHAHHAQQQHQQQPQLQHQQPEPQPQQPQQRPRQQAQQPPQQPVLSPHRATILDGRAAAAAWQEEIARDVAAVSAAIRRPPMLAVVLVGERPDSILYVQRKQEAAQRTGIDVRVLRLAGDVGQQQLEAAVADLCADPGVDAVLVQLPLPRHLDEQAVMEGLAPAKDVDGFHPINMGRTLMRGLAPRFVPATPLGVVALLSRQGLDISGSTCVVLGDSNIVGTPLAGLLRDLGAAVVTICHRMSYNEWFEGDWEQQQRARARACLPRLPGPQPHVHTPLAAAAATAVAGAHGRGGGALPVAQPTAESPGSQVQRLAAITATADVLVVAVGSPELVKAHWVKPGSVVIDCGINVVTDDPSKLGGRSSSVAAAAGTAGAAATPAGACAALTPGMEGCRVVGDVAFDEVAGVASAITPVPGGVGPCTIAALLANTVRAAEYLHGLRPW